MDPQEAVDHPRHRHENGVLLIEGRVPERRLTRLRDRGHRIEVREDFMIPAGGAQLIRILDNGVRACGSDHGTVARSPSRGVMTPDRVQPERLLSRGLWERYVVLSLLVAPLAYGPIQFGSARY